MAKKVMKAADEAPKKRLKVMKAKKTRRPSTHSRQARAIECDVDVNRQIMGATKEELCALGVDVVHSALQSQRRYCRKRKREQRIKHAYGEENLIRRCAKVMNVDLGKQIEMPPDSGSMKWWHKGRKELIDAILKAITDAM